MSLGLPLHLVPHHIRRGLSRAAHTVALVCILAAVVVVSSLQAQLPDAVLWPILLAFAIMLAVLWWADRNRTPFHSAAYLIVGTACVYWITLITLIEFPGEALSDTFVLSMAKVALIMVGGSGKGTTSAILWGTAGFVLAGVATALAVWQTGSAWIFDATAISSYLLLTALQVGLAVGQLRRTNAQPSLHRAARDEQVSAMRYRIEAKAAAVMHDTVLNHLAAISVAPDGPLNPALREKVERDLQLLIGEEWLVDADSADSDDVTSAEWVRSRLFTAINEAQELGLQVEVSGDLAAVSRLGAERAGAVAQAAKQCLVNVIKHAGTDQAEVVVYGSEGEVSVMVIDAGKGFSEEEMGPDRLGIRHSIRRRIENVGGTVQVWSTPGRGTSVLIRVPALAPEIPAVREVQR